MKAKVLLAEKPGVWNRFPTKPASVDGNNQTFFQLPSSQGKGLFKRVDLGADLALSLSDCALKKDYMAMVHDEKPVLAFSFTLQGATQTENPGLKSRLNMQQGTGCLHFFPDPVLLRKIKAGDNLQALVVKISQNKLRNFLKEEEDKFSSDFSDAVIQGNNKPFCKKFVLFPETKRLVQSFFEFTEQRFCGKMLLQAKALELMAQTLDQMGKKSSCRIKENRLGQDELEKVRQVRDRLLYELQSPPSLIELAHWAGICHTKLNRLFKVAFGCTVFEYIRNQRLEMAKGLLLDKHMTITQVAYESGFCSPSHFSASFYSKFGLQPGIFRKKQAGQMQKGQ